jgi:1-acyl-sn-glycerol-3-phosphate acyltransferase
MESPTLLYKPKSQGAFNKSPWYAVPIFFKTMALCVDFLIHSVKNRPDAATTDDYLHAFWRLHFASSHTSLYATGREYLQPGETYVFMSNHESWMDIPAIFGAVPSSLRMVAKAGIMKVPILGHAMENAGFIAIDRRNRKRAIRQLEEAKKRLSEGISIWIAPEGTRTRTGTIGAFKKGGFYLARELSKPIAPVFIEGAADVMPADSVMVKPNQSITVHFCKPVTAEEVKTLPPNQLVDLVRTRIIEKQRGCGRFSVE